MTEYCCTLGSECSELVVPALAVVSGELVKTGATAGMTASVVAVLLLTATLRPGSSFISPDDDCVSIKHTHLLKM